MEEEPSPTSLLSPSMVFPNNTYYSLAVKGTPGKCKRNTSTGAHNFGGSILSHSQILCVGQGLRQNWGGDG